MIGVLGLLSAFTGPAWGLPQAIQVVFEPTIHGEAFQCQQSYTGVGRQHSTIRIQDFRLYVSGLRLINAQGEEVPLTLEQNTFQHQNLALLDFEDATGHCQGTPATHHTITASVPPGHYRGLKFELGVPFALNHQNPVMAPSPLNMSSMFWVWRFGYKFARLDFASTGMPQGYFIHLGSTECLGSAKANNLSNDASHSTSRATEAPLHCENPNRPTIFLPDFDPLQSHIPVRLDVGTLLQNSNVDTNQAQSAAGCMSGTDDKDCDAIFEQLGLGQGPQQFFSWSTRPKESFK